MLNILSWLKRHPIVVAILFDVAGYAVLETITLLSMLLMFVGGGIMMWTVREENNKEQPTNNKP